MHKTLDNLPNRDIITFHEAFPYFAEEFDLHIVKVVNREPDSQPSAKELADTIRLIESTGVKAVFAEPQYSTDAAQIIAQESGAEVYICLLYTSMPIPSPTHSRQARQTN